MNMSDYTFLVETKIRLAEMETRAAEERLARAFRQAARERRVAEREARRLENAFDGDRPGLLRVLRNWLAPDRSVADGTAEQAGRSEQSEPTEAVNAGSDARTDELIKAGR